VKRAMPLGIKRLVLNVSFVFWMRSARPYNYLRYGLRWLPILVCFNGVALCNI